MRASEFRTVAAEKATTFKNAFRSREGFKNFIETSPTALDRHGNPSERQIWSNEDLDPTPPEKVLFEPFWWAIRTLLTTYTEDVEMVELCHLLYGPVLWKLDFGQYHGWHWIELVAEHSRDLRQSNYLVHRDVFQLQVRQCLPHWLSSRGAQCLWHVGKLLFCRCKSCFGHHLVWCPA